MTEPREKTPSEIWGARWPEALIEYRAQLGAMRGEFNRLPEHERRLCLHPTGYALEHWRAAGKFPYRWGEHELVDLWRMHRIRAQAARRSVRKSIIAILALSLALWVGIWFATAAISAWIAPFL